MRLGRRVPRWTRETLRTTVPRVRALPLAIVLLVSACNAGGARFNTQTAASFVPARHSVSVLGIYKDGRMTIDTWDKLAPHLVPALGSSPCEVGFDSLVRSNQELANAVDDRSRAEGPTGSLLAQLAPAARGDLLLVVTLAGRLPQHQGQGEPPEGAPVPNGMTTQRKRRHQAQNSAGGAPDPNRLEVSAALFSVPEHRSVALVSMSYGGQDADDAMTRFGAELAQVMPNSTCAGWNWDFKIDPASLRAPVAE